MILHNLVNDFQIIMQGFHFLQNYILPQYTFLKFCTLQLTRIMCFLQHNYNITNNNQTTELCARHWRRRRHFETDWKTHALKVNIWPLLTLMVFHAS